MRRGTRTPSSTGAVKPHVRRMKARHLDNAARPRTPPGALPPPSDRPSFRERSPSKRPASRLAPAAGFAPPPGIAVSPGPTRSSGLARMRLTRAQTKRTSPASTTHRCVELKRRRTFVPSFLPRTSASSPSDIDWTNLPRWVRLSAGRIQSKTAMAAAAATVIPPIVRILLTDRRMRATRIIRRKRAGRKERTPPKSAPMEGRASTPATASPIRAIVTSATPVREGLPAPGAPPAGGPPPAVPSVVVASSAPDGALPWGTIRSVGPPLPAERLRRTATPLWARAGSRVETTSRAGSAGRPSRMRSPRKARPSRVPAAKRA